MGLDKPSLIELEVERHDDEHNVPDGIAENAAAGCGQCQHYLDVAAADALDFDYPNADYYLRDQ